MQLWSNKGKVSNCIDICVDLYYNKNVNTLVVFYLYSLFRERAKAFSFFNLASRSFFGVLQRTGKCDKIDKVRNIGCCLLVFCFSPSGFFTKEGRPMNTLEVLTLLLVVFAVLSYIDKK